MLEQERRRIETDLFEGKIRGVAATNALELGIDIGHIDATLHLGFPGSIASLWQQAGRSGRRARPSLAVYVAFEGPLDQYFMKFPQKLFGSPIEHCQVDANNQKVLEQHIACAASELPLCQYDENYFGSGLDCAIVALKNKGYLRTDPCVSPKLWNYIGPEPFSRYIMCNATDLATECVNPHETRAFAERILLYDRHPGGIGIAAQVNASDLVIDF
ncbi:hypothetical protein BHM03_00035506 [Ensete ventricosum]|nr:hypothetical protein BHM03_00035506 [Ensete ventricosum]